MPRRVVGLDIGTSAVRAVELSVGSGSPDLLAFGQVTLPRGAVVDGEVIERPVVADALKRLWKQGRFKQVKVSVGIAGLRAITRDLDMPAVPDDELDSAVKFQAGELIPFPPEQTVLASQVLGGFTGPEGQPMLHVLVAAAHQDLVGSVVGAILDAGLIPESVDLSSSAIVRAVAGPNPSPGPEAIVSVGAGMTIVTVHRLGSPDFVRTIGQGGQAATDAISSSLGIPSSDAEVLKRRIGEPFPNLREVEAATQEPAGVLVGEIRSSLEYYASLPGRTAVSHVLLTGAGSRLPCFRSKLESQIGIPVVDASPLSYLDLSKIDLDQSEVALIDSLMAVGVGAALPELGRGTGKFNLLPAEVGQRLAERRMKRRLVMAAAAVVVLMALGSGIRIYQTHNTQHEVDAANMAIATLNAQITRYDDVVQTANAIKATKTRIVSSLSGEVSWPVVMDQLSRNIPSGVWLTAFTANLPSPGTASSGGSSSSSTAGSAAGTLAGPGTVIATITVTGNGPLYGGAAAWITQMDSSPAFSNTYVSTISSSGNNITFASTLDVMGAAHSTRVVKYTRSDS